MPDFVFAFDLDGTVTTEEILPRLAEALGLRPEMERLTRAAVRGEASPQDAVAAIQLASRRYAKRQLTWLRRDPDLFWIRHEKTPDMDRACRLSTQFLSGCGIE